MKSRFQGQSAPLALAAELRLVGEPAVHVAVEAHQEEVASALREVLASAGECNGHALRLDAERCIVEIDGCAARLRRTSFQLFSHLVRNDGRWVGSDVLREEVLHMRCRVGASNVRWHVLEARRALGAFDWCLHSDSRRGYMFKLGACGGSHCRHKALDRIGAASALAKA